MTLGAGTRLAVPCPFPFQALHACRQRRRGTRSRRTSLKCKACSLLLCQQSGLGIGTEAVSSTGESGIRTHGTPFGVHTLSKRAPSATRTSLQRLENLTRTGQRRKRLHCRKVSPAVAGIAGRWVAWPSSQRRCCLPAQDHGGCWRTTPPGPKTLPGLSRARPRRRDGIARRLVICFSDQPRVLGLMRRAAPGRYTCDRLLGLLRTSTAAGSSCLRSRTRCLGRRESGGFPAATLWGIQGLRGTRIMVSTHVGYGLTQVVGWTDGCREPAVCAAGTSPPLDYHFVRIRIRRRVYI